MDDHTRDDIAGRRPRVLGAADRRGGRPSWIREVEASLPSPADHEACAAWVEECLDPFVTPGLRLQLIGVLYSADGIEVDPEPLEDLAHVRGALLRLGDVDVSQRIARLRRVARAPSATDTIPPAVRLVVDAVGRSRRPGGLATPQAALAHRARGRA